MDEGKLTPLILAKSSLVLNFLDFELWRDEFDWDLGFIVLVSLMRGEEG